MAKPDLYPIAKFTVRGSTLSAKDKAAVREVFRQTKAVKFSGLVRGKKARTAASSALTVADTATGGGKVRLIPGHAASKSR